MVDVYNRQGSGREREKSDKKEMKIQKSSSEDFYCQLFKNLLILVKNNISSRLYRAFLSYFDKKEQEKISGPPQSMPQSFDPL